MSKIALITGDVDYQEFRECIFLLDKIFDSDYICHIFRRKKVIEIKSMKHQVYSMDEFSPSNYELIFCFNFTKFNLIRGSRCPVILIKSNKDNKIKLDFMKIIPNIDMIITFCGENIIDFFTNFPDGFVNFYTPLPENGLISNNVSGTYKILVDINSMFSPNLLYKIIPILNKCIGTVIDIKTAIDIKPITNSHINAVLEYDINNYLLIIGNKRVIINAIINNIPSIILGDNGYGGILTQRNLKQLYYAHFNGRPYGYLGEDIPERLVIEDIQNTLHNKKKKEIYKIRNGLLDINNAEVKKIQQSINQLLFLHNTLFDENFPFALKINDVFKIHQESKDKWKITDCFNKFMFSIGSDEYLIINSFVKPHKVKEILVKFNNKHIVLDFIKALLHNKILKVINKL